MGGHASNLKKRQDGRHDGSPAAPEDEILTSREARRLLKIGRTKLHELTKDQLIPAYRIGSGKTSSLRYLRSDLLDWLHRQRV